MKITDRQRIFAQNIVMGTSRIEAYANAGYSVRNKKAAENNASRLMENEGVKNRIRELREKDEKSVLYTRKKLIRFLCGVLEIPYTSLLNPDTGALKSFEDNPQLAAMVTGYKVQEKVNANGDVWGIDKDPKFYSKEKAVDQLIKIMGWNEPQKLEIDSGLSIVERIRKRAKQQ
jgi:hypothetical protein